jgi:hypothetical protein
MERIGYKMRPLGGFKGAQKFGIKPGVAEKLSKNFKKGDDRKFCISIADVLAKFQPNREKIKPCGSFLRFSEVFLRGALWRTH